MRFLLGVFEGAGVTLGGLQISMWWRKEEQGLRSAVVFSTLSSVVNGLLSYAMQFYTPGPLSRWRLLFVVMGCWSCLVGFIGLTFLADSPVKAWWLVSPATVAVADIRPTGRRLLPCAALRATRLVS
jgi:sugar phosphate permease